MWSLYAETRLETISRSKLLMTYLGSCYHFRKSLPYRAPQRSFAMEKALTVTPELPSEIRPESIGICSNVPYGRTSSLAMMVLL